MIPFELQPILEGKLLRLRPLLEADFEALYAVASDPLVWEQHPRKDRYKRDVFKDFFRDAISSGGAFLAIDAKTGEAVGSSRYHSFKPELSEVEIGYTFLARRCWGHTYNREMKRLMLEHAFRFVDSVVFVIGEDNGRSRAAVEKIGAKFEGALKREYAGGVSYGSVLYRLRKGHALP
ncbi:MAG: GNAT family N-acetyltransferase [Bdellovibrionota bacterium]